MFQIRQQHHVVFKVTLVLVILLDGYGNSYRIQDNPYRRGEILDNHGGSDRYKLEWMVDQHTHRITFNVTVQTTGWILLGFARNADMQTGRDVVVGGVWPNGRSYISDKHIDRNNKNLEKDVNQDYTLLNSWESETHTFLSFSRQLDTCDKEDYPITENRVTIIWAYGENDNEEGGSGGGNRGSYDLYLLDPEFTPRLIPPKHDQAPRVTGRMEPTTRVWTVTRTRKIPSNDTSYMCAIHKAPRLNHKHHVIGYEVRLEDEISRIHTHHMVVHRCRAPQGFSPWSLFESFAHTGQEESCFLVGRQNTGAGSMPLHFCQQFYAVWALGGRAFFTPDHVGFPFGEDPDEYYLVQVHYDNPQMRSDITVTINLDFFYTPFLRINDGGLIVMGHEVPGLPLSAITPPQTSSIRRFGHCSRECTRRILPKDGITLFAGMLHSHTSGRQLRVHHFRRNHELPWILYDDNYANNFQQIRALPRGEIKIFQGDQLTVDCTYDNTWANGTIVGGFRTSEEMCLFWGVYYNVMTEYSSCRSEIVAPKQYRQHFLAGVTNLTWLESRMDWVAVPPSPGHLVGRTLTDISDNFVEWDEGTRRELVDMQRQSAHTGKCNRHLSDRDPMEVERLLEIQRQFVGDRPGLVLSGSVETNVNTADDYNGPVGYPIWAKAYTIPETTCQHRGSFPTVG